MRIAYAMPLPPKADDVDRAGFLRRPLFAGYLSSYADVHRHGKDEHDIVDAEELHGLNGSNAVVERLLQTDPELVALSVFVWNHRRVAKLCRKLRKRAPSVKVVLGGPEVAFAPQISASRFQADWVCTGEGEVPFLHLLDALDQNPSFAGSMPGLIGRNAPCRPGNAPLVSRLDDIPSPYLNGLLQVDSDRWVDLETTRGCQFDCGFCLYGKTATTLRRFSLSRVATEVKHVLSEGATSIYFLDPTFNSKRERCRRLCRRLARLNDGLHADFHVEARAELMDERLADDFVKAGIKSVEVGLQSTNEESLALMKRGRIEQKNFLDGCRLLFERGIEVEVGVIAGLPRESANHVRATARFVLDNSLGELTVHRLQVLPGTAYHKRAKELELDYSEEPPYYLRSTPTLTDKRIGALVKKYDDRSVRAYKSYKRELKSGSKRLRKRLQNDAQCEHRFAKLMRKVYRKALVGANPSRASHQPDVAEGLHGIPPDDLKRSYKQRRKRLLSSAESAGGSVHERLQQAVNFVCAHQNRKKAAKYSSLDLSWVPKGWWCLISSDNSTRRESSQIDFDWFAVFVLSQLMLELEGRRSSVWREQDFLESADSHQLPIIELGAEELQLDAAASDTVVHC
jgi:radical SAM superfamily enzyme YgiQ (UPF0313 family)